MGLLTALRGLASSLTSADSTAQGTGAGTPSILVDGATTYGGALWTRLRTIVRSSGATTADFSEASLDPSTGGVNVYLAGGSGSLGTVTQGNGNADATQAWTMRLSTGSGFISTLPVSLASLPVLATGTNTIGAVTGPSAAPLALDATLTGGTALAQIRGGAKGATVAATVTSTANGSDHQGADTVEQYAPAAEDNTNAVYAEAGKPVNSATYSISMIGAALASNATSFRASSGQVYGLSLVNRNASVRYYCLVNKASAPVTSDTAVWMIAVPGGTTQSVGRDLLGPSGKNLSTGVAGAWASAMGGSVSAPTITTLGTAGEHDAIVIGI